MNPEQRYVINLLQDAPTAGTLRGLNALGEADWTGIMAAAEVLGVSPLLLRRVADLRLNVPETVRSRLRKIVETHTARNMRLLQEFGQVARALQAQDIPFIPFKGVHLCTYLYENIGERPIWDMDVLVPLGRMREVLEVLRKEGYRASRPFDLDLEVRSYHHLPAFVRRGAAPLEIHWTLLNPRFDNGLGWQELWERSVPARIGDAEVRVFSPEDLLVYLCAHVAYQHIYMDSVRSLYDIKLLVQREGGKLDWGAATARAKTWRLANSMYLTLRITDELIGCPVPRSAWDTLKPSIFSERIAQAALARLLEHPERSPVVSAVWAKRSLPQRLKGLWGRIVIPPAVLAGRYKLPPGSRKVNLYYLVRLRDMIRQHGGSLMALLLGRRSRNAAAMREAELIAYLRWW